MKMTPAETARPKRHRANPTRWLSFGLASLVAVSLLVACGGDADGPAGELRARLESRIAASGAEVVGVYFRDLATGDSLLLDADRRVHAASMMKVPVLIQLFRDAEAGRLSLDDSLTLTHRFRSIVDGSPYELGAPDDSDTTLYARGGQRESIRQLAELMITVSSNLATNLLIEHVGAERVQASIRELGADSIAVLRGVEDIKAYEAGLNNTTTARDLGIIFTAIAEGRAAAEASCREMVAILSRQRFNEGIPAGLAPGTRVAHKTGSITRIRHDGGIVYRGDGTAYVLVVLVRGIEESSDADRLIADLSRIVADEVGTATIDASARNDASAAAPTEGPRIAITIDDLPWNGPAPPSGVAAATRRLLSALGEHGAPATGFVVCSRMAEDDPVLRLWLEEGMELGSHTEAHRDLNDAPLALWLDDVRSCDRALSRLTGEPVRFFRFPYLHQGPTDERRSAALNVLDELGYRIAHVTIDNSDYVLARPYDAALSRGDEEARRRILDLFVDHILTMTRHYREVANRKRGRDVSHILLLHANALVADGMAPLLEALDAERFEVVSLDEALEDPVYDLPDAYLGRKGLSWLYRIEPLGMDAAGFDDQQADELRARLRELGS